jgi:hypothetical protein
LQLRTNHSTIVKYSGGHDVLHTKKELRCRTLKLLQNQ